MTQSSIPNFYSHSHTGGVLGCIDVSSHARLYKSATGANVDAHVSGIQETFMIEPTDGTGTVNARDDIDVGQSGTVNTSR